MALGNGARTVVTFALGMILVRLLDQAQYGIYRQVWLLYNLLSPLFVLGLPTSIYYFLPRLSPERRKGFVLQSFLILALLGALLTLTVLLIPVIWTVYQDDSGLLAALRAFFLYPLFFLPTALWPGLPLALGRSRDAAVGTLGLALLRATSILVPILLGGGLTGAFYGASIGALFQCLAVALYILRFFRPFHTQWDRAMVRQQVGFALPLGISRLISLLGIRLDNLIVALFFKAQRYAVYDVGAIEIPFLSTLMTSAMDVLMVEFSRSLRDQEHRRAVTLWHEAVRRVSLITLPFFGYLLFMADRVITLLYTDAYAESAIPFRIYLFLMLVRVTRYGDIFIAAGQTNFIFYSSVFFVLVTGVCGVLGIKFLGFVGPPLAAVASRYLLVLVMLLKARRLLRVNLRQIMPWKVLARNLAVALGAGMLVFPLASLPWPDISVVALSSALYFGLYVGGAWWKLVTEADLSILSRWMFLDRLGLRLPSPGRRQ